MKPGKGDKKVRIRFTPEEFDFLQDNAWMMSESFGLDTRIYNLTGQRAIGFYRWDLECLHDVSFVAKKVAPEAQIPMIDALLDKLELAMKQCG